VLLPVLAETIMDKDLKSIGNFLSTSLRQFKAAIEHLNSLTQQQIAKLEQRMEVGFANVDTKFASFDTKFTKLEGDIEDRFTKIEGDIATLSTEVKNFEKRMTDLKIDQRAQDQHFFGLSIFIITFTAGVAAKLAKLY
jgi:hypothetical protein